VAALDGASDKFVGGQARLPTFSQRLADPIVGDLADSFPPLRAETNPSRWLDAIGSRKTPGLTREGAPGIISGG
jgi:hypothetical protein